MLDCNSMATYKSMVGLFLNFAAACLFQAKPFSRTLAEALKEVSFVSYLGQFLFFG